jgi:hypothetical protein
MTELSARGRDRCLPWGVSPRVGTTKRQKAPEGRQIFGCGVSRSPPARTSVAAPRLKALVSQVTARSYFLGVSRGIAGGALITDYLFPETGSLTVTVVP